MALPTQRIVRRGADGEYHGRTAQDTRVAQREQATVAGSGSGAPNAPSAGAERQSNLRQAQAYHPPVVLQKLSIACEEVDAKRQFRVEADLAFSTEQDGKMHIDRDFTASMHVLPLLKPAPDADKEKGVHRFPLLIRDESMPFSRDAVALHAVNSSPGAQATKLTHGGAAACATLNLNFPQWAPSNFVADRSARRWPIAVALLVGTETERQEVHQGKRTPLEGSGIFCYEVEKHTDTQKSKETGEEIKTTSFVPKLVERLIVGPGGRFLHVKELFGGEEGEGEDEQECVICLSEPRDTMLMPCRHLCLCSSCPCYTLEA